jgi:dTMP kinase
VTPRRRARALGLYVAVEGIDGSGKSTLLRALGRALRRHGLAVRLRHEPVDPTIGRLAQEAGSKDPWTGAVYFTVDRHLAAPRLRRDLRRFDLVLSDRSYFSTIAYQGSRLPPAERARVEALQRAATVAPDLVILLDLPATWLARRLAARTVRRGPLERARRLAGVAQAYRRLARRHRWVVLDARRPPRELLTEAVDAVERWRRPNGGHGREKTLRGPRGPRRAG